jgi:hypothetical protein
MKARLRAATAHRHLATAHRHVVTRLASMREALGAIERIARAFRPGEVHEEARSVDELRALLLAAHTREASLVAERAQLRARVDELEALIRVLAPLPGEDQPVTLDAPPVAGELGDGEITALDQPFPGPQRPR